MSTKTKARFNSIDLLLVIIIIGCIVGVVLRYQLVDLINTNNDASEAEITFMVEDLRNTSEVCFKVGDEFYIVEDSQNKCILADISFKDSVKYNLREDGTLIEAPVEGRSDAVGKLRATGTYSEEQGFLLFGTTYIAPGKEMQITNEKIDVNITISKITLLDGEGSSAN